MIDYSDILTAAITVGGTLGGIWLKDYVIPKKHKQILTTDKAVIYVALDKLAATVKQEMCADSVYIAYFHNGGHFINGATMDKYTIVGEDYKPTLKSVKPTGVSVMLSNFSYNFHKLTVNNACYNNALIATYDRCYIDWLRSRDIEHSFNVSILENTSNKLIGFMSIEYTNLGDELKYDNNKIWKFSNKAAKLINDLKNI